MRILLTVHHTLNPDAGAAGVTSQLSDHFRETDHAADVFSFDDLATWVPPKLAQVVFPLAVTRRLLARRDDYDVVDASSGDTWIFGLLPVRRPLLVVRSHGLEHAAHEVLLEDARSSAVELSWKYPLYHGGWRLKEVALSFRSADLAIFLNAQDRDFAINRLGVQRGRAVVMPNGIPDDFVDLPFEPTPAAGEPIGIAQIGTYLPRKGVRYAVPALESVLLRHPEVSVSFIGTGVREAVVLEDFDVSVRERVTVISEYPHDELPSLLRGHHVKLFPTLFEGFSLALVEAMACGLAPVVTAVSGTQGVVAHEATALTIPVRNSDAIASALERLIADRVLLDRLRRGAYCEAQHYSWSVIASRTLSLYEQAMSEKGFRQ